MIKKAIIPAAGMGTRSLPITKVLPKEMFPICGRPAIDYLVEEAIEAGIEEILIVTSRSKDMIIDYYDRSIELEEHLKAKHKSDLIKIITPPNVHLQYVRQIEPTGLGSAILLGKSFVGSDPFVVMLPDEIMITKEENILTQLINMYQSHKGNIIALKKVRKNELKHYGVVEAEEISKECYKVLDIIEKPQLNPPSQLAVIGRYVFDPEIFQYLSDLKPGVGAEIQLTDGIQKMLANKDCYGIEINGDRYDIAQETEYVKLINFLFHKLNGKV
ncbi:UTP--glucose-1-phosphate uridylyltransferase [Pontibacillus chungwhensis BH030062]|uniref:UTP--glucose-1-phosphate uridylyltransferase n=1 Tax=Pontibacillus chungwhensis BH030062 TaxID=1385513 RepID=A0A0A2UT37_9BACI|nr:UTP--glucose-1-phosphate uridylyltransferase [Pontibacillus chungwhensis]KGP91099.1 UTP--glucose-1-phosphate uridylyltransferase [Pontibacillus chungwhensis BH030062]